MYLLILETQFSMEQDLKEFTFHNVSINSSQRLMPTMRYKDLHSIMYLLILQGKIIFCRCKRDLHSIMYLLIHRERQKGGGNRTIYIP